MEHFHCPLTQICNNSEGVSLPFLVTPTNLVLKKVHGTFHPNFVLKKVHGTFHPFGNNKFEKSRKNRKKLKISVLTEFHASLTKQPRAAHTCYLHSLYPYPCSLNVLS